MKNSLTVNAELLMKEAEWHEPVWGNVILRVTGFAMAFRCDDCYRDHTKKVKYAVEWNNDLSIVKYHEVEKLQNMPPEIFKLLDMLEHGRGKIAG